jgi:hypothetical protein
MGFATAGVINKSLLALAFFTSEHHPDLNRNLRNLCNLRIFNLLSSADRYSALDSRTEHTDNQSFKGMDKHSVTSYFLQWI